MRVLLLLLFLLAVHPVAADAGNSKYLEFTRTAARVVTNDEEGKLFIVGDVHGCLDELSELVRRYRKPEETLVFVGDLTMKGPHSEEVVQELMRWGAVGVLGNNDYALVAAYDTLQRDPNSEAARRIVESTPMSEASLEWLRSLPLAMRFPKHNLIVVHAGVIPGSTPEETPDEALLNMRTFLPSPSSVSSPASRWSYSLSSGGPLWASVWYGPETVVFGHDAVTSLQSHPLAVGIDTGCVYGGSLSALRWPARDLVSVAARYTHVNPGRVGKEL